jgi:hypothetical protein
VCPMVLFIFEKSPSPSSNPPDQKVDENAPKPTPKIISQSCVAVARPNYWHRGAYPPRRPSAAASLLGGGLPKAETRPHRFGRRAAAYRPRSAPPRFSCAPRPSAGRALGRTLLPTEACSRRTAAHAHGRRRRSSMAGQRWLSVLGVLCLVSTVCPRCPPSPTRL